MAGRVFQVTQPKTEWLKRVATGLLDQEPQMKPLEAVRRAMDVAPESMQEDPQKVASSLLASDSNDADRQGPPGEPQAVDERKRRRA